MHLKWFFKINFFGIIFLGDFMITKYYNAKILTSAYEDIIDGELVVKDNKIVFVGKKYDGECDEQFDCQGNLLMPGFINCHAHSAMTLLKGVGEGESLENWLFGHIIPKEKLLTEKDIYDGTSLAVKEMLKNGITCFQDSYFFPEQTAKACQDNGMRVYISLSQGYSQNKFLSYDELESLYNKLKNNDGLINYNFYFHSVYTCDEKQFINTINLAKKHGTFLGTHASETLTEVGECTQTHGGLTPIQLLDSYGFFDVPTLIAHGVHLQKEDYEILENKQVSVAHNPSSNLKLGSGIANLKALKAHNINICLGTDGSASNNRLDMFREIYLSSVLQKGIFNDPMLITSSDAIAFATENGAKALCNDKIGKLKVDNLADFIMIDLHSINNQVCNDIKSNIVYACGVEDILMTVVDGKVVYKK